LKSFDEDVRKKWQELVVEQRREMNELNVPYFETDSEKGDMGNRTKILALLEDLLPGGSDT